MHLLRLGPAGQEILAVAEGGTTYDLRPLTADVDGAFLAADGVARVRAALAAGALPVLDGADRLRRGAPIARPAAVVCIGQNYAANAAESGAEPPATPIVFPQPPNPAAGPGDQSG